VTRFHAHNRSSATLAATPEQVWEVLTDPDLIVRFTPNLRRIDVDGDRWTWHLTRIPVLSAAVEPSFTELMTYDAPRRIDFRHDPARTDEQAGVDGEYLLEPVPGGTEVTIDLSIWVELPLPRLLRPAVERVMSTVVAGMGLRFGQHVRKHLDGNGAGRVG
jgi:carbon monoxide dehydrogenase subunit G